MGQIAEVTFPLRLELAHVKVEQESGLQTPGKHSLQAVEICSAGHKLTTHKLRLWRQIVTPGRLSRNWRCGDES